MENLTSVEVKCECSIPFHSELTDYIQKLASGTINENYNEEQVPHKEAITHAIRSKMLFVKFGFAVSIKKVQPRLLKAIKKILKKELIGTIRVGKDEITLILL